MKEELTNLEDPELTGRWKSKVRPVSYKKGTK